MHHYPAETSVFSPRFVQGLGQLASNYDVLLCDVWGVVHNGVAHFERAADALIRFRNKGGSVVLITNAPRPKAKIINLLDRLAVPHEAYDGVASSGDVTVAMILERGDAPLAHIGPGYDESVYAEAERLAGRSVRRVAVDEASYVVCTGLVDAQKEMPEDYRALLERLKHRKLDFICANPDIVVEVGETRFYCAGSLAELYADIGGTVIQAGKPHLPIYERALAVAAEARGEPIDRRRVLAIGDGLGTDIKGGANSAIDTLFVTAGIHRAQLHEETGAIDVAALQRLFEANAVWPNAILSELVW